jgi:hypothetical protein
MKKSGPTRKPTAAQITKAKNALYEAVLLSIEHDDVDDTFELEEHLKDSSDEWSDALKMVWDMTPVSEPRAIKAFKLSAQDFKKVQIEVEDSCLSNEGKKAILKAMGVDE